MPPEEFERLVSNVRLDGRLTSAVLCCENLDRSIEILSGHHRTLAAIEVELNPIDCIVITTPLDDERKTAIQLSHNAVAGKDNPSILADMYRNLGLDAKMFSGLTDVVLDYDRINVVGFTAGVQYEELLLAFLPDDRQSFEQSLKRVRSSNRLAATHFARYEDFSRIFDAIVSVKDKKAIVNSAMALAVMAELAMERLDQLAGEEDSDAAA